MNARALWALIVSPSFYYFGLIAGSLTYPGYSQVTQYASELGSSEAPYPWLFNFSIIAYGAATIFGAYGFWLALSQISNRRLWVSLAVIALLLWGIAMIIGGIFPIPDERHGAYGLGLAGQFTSLFALIALWRVPNSAGIRAFLAFIFVSSLIFFVIMMGVGGLVRLDNVGIWQRVNGLFAIPWITVLGLWLLGRVRPDPLVAAD